MKYRKKPVVIDALQFDGTVDSKNEICAYFGGIETMAVSTYNGMVNWWKIGTLEGGHEVSAGDYIICGVKGEYYPCKPDIFEMTYEKEFQQMSDSFEKWLNNNECNEEWFKTHNVCDYAKAAFLAGQEAEREECAKLAEGCYLTIFHINGQITMRDRIAAAIKARGKE
jgi:hypothetical protein